MNGGCWLGREGANSAGRVPRHAHYANTQVEAQWSSLGFQETILRWIYWGQALRDDPEQGWTAQSCEVYRVHL